MAVLVLADVDNGRLTPATGRIVAAASQLGAVDLLTGRGTGTEAATLAGAHRVLEAELPPAAEAFAPALARLADRYTHVVTAANAVGRDLIPRLAALLDLMPVTDVTAILGPDRFERPIYAGNAVETVRDTQPKHLLTLRASAFPRTASDNAAPVEDLDIAAAETVARVTAQHRTDSTRPDLSTAQVVVAGGISVGDRFELVEELASRLGGAVGATRAAVDAGFAPNELQVGQTGKIVAPELYIGLGVSGAIQHLAGIQGARTVVAVNTDPEAPLMKMADLALVADLFEAVPQLIAELDRLGVKR